jgi:hypothetical protein
MSEIPYRRVVELALSRVEAVRPEPGKYKGTFTARLAVDLRVGQDYEQEMPVNVPWRLIAALALSRLNQVTIDAIVREACALPEEPQHLTDLADKAVDAVKKIQSHRGKQKCNGRVTGSAVLVDVIEADIERRDL